MFRQIQEELGDLLEVISALLKVYNMEFTDVQESATNTGGFDGGTYVDFVEIESDNPSYLKYRSRPDKYPEIKGIKK